MRKRLPTVTVGAAAYNEEVNIVNFLKSVLNQKEEGFILKWIFVISDGSKDRTVRIAKSINNQKIKVVDSKRRLGQPTRLNQIYSRFDSDYLIQTDADTIFANNDDIKKIVETFEKNKEVVMCGGKIYFLKPKSLVQRAVYVSDLIYKTAGDLYRHGNNIFTAHGAFLAYRKKYIKSVRIPKDVIANDKYVYLTSVTRGLNYKFVNNAAIYTELPLTLKDQIKQNTRFKTAKEQLALYFPLNLLKKEYYLPKGLIVKNLIYQIILNPVPLMYMFLINRYCKLLAKRQQKKMSNILWDKLERTVIAVN